MRSEGTSVGRSSEMWEEGKRMAFLIRCVIFIKSSGVLGN